MVSACLTWNGATKPFFVNGCGVKMNAKVYKQHLQKELVPAVQHLYKNKNWIFVQDNTPSHRLKIFYKKQSIYVLSKHMNGPHRHLIAIPSIFSSEDKAIEYVKSMNQKIRYWVLFNVFWSDLRKMGPWKEELVLVDQFL